MNIQVNPWYTRTEELKRLCKKLGITGYSRMKKDELLQKIKIIEVRPAPEARLGLLAYVKGYKTTDEFFDNWWEKDNEIREAFGDAWMYGQIGQDDDDGDIYISCELDIDTIGEVMACLMEIDKNAKIDEYIWEDLTKPRKRKQSF